MTEAGRTADESIVPYRLELLRRETVNLRNARRILSEIEARTQGDALIVRESRRAVELAENAQRLGIVDARRVGASAEQLAEATGLDPSQIDAVVRGR